MRHHLMRSQERRRKFSLKSPDEVNSGGQRESEILFQGISEDYRRRNSLPAYVCNNVVNSDAIVNPKPREWKKIRRFQTITEDPNSLKVLLMVIFLALFVGVVVGISIYKVYNGLKASPNSTNVT